MKPTRRPSVSLDFFPGHSEIFVHFTIFYLFNKFIFKCCELLICNVVSNL